LNISFKDHFSKISGDYRAFRPEYPDELFRWLASVAPRRERAMDCGCGTGQATVGLARYFAMVSAVDPSPEQISNARVKKNIAYSAAPAEETGAPDKSQDVVIAAQSLHWFDLDRFYPELRRITRKDGVFAAFSYGLLTVSHDIDVLIRHLYHDIIGNCWPPERRHVDEGYRTLPFPFDEITAPGFEMSTAWSFEQMLGYLSTWSAVKEFRASTSNDPLMFVESDLKKAWGEDEKMTVRWPLSVRAGIVS